MVPDFVHVGFTAATPLPNQGFPARFLVDGIMDAEVSAQIRAKHGQRNP